MNATMLLEQKMQQLSATITYQYHVFVGFDMVLQTIVGNVSNIDVHCTLYNVQFDVVWGFGMTLHCEVDDPGIR